MASLGTNFSFASARPIAYRSWTSHLRYGYTSHVFEINSTVVRCGYGGVCRASSNVSQTCNYSPSSLPSFNAATAIVPILDASFCRPKAAVIRRAADTPSCLNPPHFLARITTAAAAAAALPYRGVIRCPHMRNKMRGQVRRQIAAPAAGLSVWLGAGHSSVTFAKRANVTVTKCPQIPQKSKCPPPVTYQEAGLNVPASCWAAIEHPNCLKLTPELVQADLIPVDFLFEYLVISKDTE
ncbi:hypothetical protein BDP55DRAFT_322224 [Colletotrichum godetiae]|uniref:Uncharacterized protein n=1 Tax=Colletotrichum godetiae TaxID=1209918 RepID=A0AAJ0AEB7_9PEZI|nr:uncharacterized protein BDP55DRAFT_322224 [Colletotrichum godetiae]KAK1660127.1 hypothetical protein BDP55DRAFT_322224 [Colletotrichum godetiae]